MRPREGPRGIWLRLCTEAGLLCRAGKVLPAVQFLQKSIQRHLDDVSRLYVLPAGLAGRAGAAPNPAGSTSEAAPCIVCSGDRKDQH